jgi:hypothetical protein
MALWSERNRALLIWARFPLLRTARAGCDLPLTSASNRVLTLNSARVPGCGEKPESGDHEALREETDQEERWRVN